MKMKKQILLLQRKFKIKTEAKRLRGAFIEGWTVQHLMSILRRWWKVKKRYKQQGRVK
jgi:hypothetical protein